jgi:hypothetical protein
MKTPKKLFLRKTVNNKKIKRRNKKDELKKK